MVNKLSTIGFRVETREQYLAIAQELVETAEIIDMFDGEYLRWSSASGAEMWMHADLEGGLTGMVPHFAGESLVRIRLEKRVTRPEQDFLDGAFYGTFGSGDYPVVFDCPDSALSRARRLPTDVDVQIAAFAMSIEVFDSQEAFRSKVPRFSSRSYIPSGTFNPTPDGGTIDPPISTAIFSGHITKSALKRNEYSGNEFYWVIAESLDASFDVVIDPQLVERAPKVGDVLLGSFWLSGRIMN